MSMINRITAIVAVILFLSELVAYAADDPRGIEVVYGEPRTALVIGNSSYLSSPLRNPVNDASDIARLLEQRKFDVMLLTDADKTQMEVAIKTFGEKLAHGGVGLFFYAGHAMQIKGINYLIPVEAFPRKEGDIKHQAVDAGLVLTELDGARSRLNLAILDACRDNPFARSFRSISRGLARMDAPRGTLIAYATSPGRTAADGEGTNSVYTKHLLDQMSVPGQEMQTMFKKIRAGVEKETGGVQTSEEWNRVIGDFYFTPIDFLDQDLKLTTEELDRYRQLLAEQQAADDRMRELEAEKNATIAKMEQEIETLRKKIAQPGSANSTLDQLIALGKQREQDQKDIEAARAKAEEERRKREAEIARLRAQELANRKLKFKNDYRKYLWIINSEFMQGGEKQQAWKLICKSWSVTDASDTPGKLFWDDRTGAVSWKRSTGMNLVGSWVLHYSWSGAGEKNNSSRVALTLSDDGSFMRGGYSGKWWVDGNTIVMDGKGARYTGQLETENSMEGHMVDKSDGDRGKWGAKRIPAEDSRFPGRR